MSSYKTFAVLGAGNIGGPIISALLAAKSAGTVSRVVAVSRSDSKSSVPDGAEVARVDYESHSSLTKALVGVDVVIGAIAFSALHQQAAVARAAKECGTKLFVLASYGLAEDQELDTDEARPLMNRKREANKDVQAILPTVNFYAGGFSDWLWQPFLELGLTTGKVSIGGDGNAPISFTSRDDIACFVTHMLTSLPPVQLENRIFRIQGDYMSFNEIFRAYEEKHNVKLEVTYVPIDELKKKAKENPGDFVTILHLIWAQGYGTVGEPLDNGLWPEWTPNRVIEFL